MFPLSNDEEVLLGCALLENLQRVHQLIVVWDAAPFGSGITKRKPGDGVAEQPVDL